MNKPAGRKTSLRRAIGAALIAATAAMPVLLGPVERASADSVRLNIGDAPRSLIPIKLLIGEWLTIVRTNGRPQPVRLHIHTVEPGKTAGKLIYASPRRCTVDLEYGGPDRGRHIFYIVPFTNCFQYRKTDHIALINAEPLTQTLSDLSAEAGNYRHMPKDQSARADGATSDADPAKTPPTKSGPLVERMEYRIVLGERAVESGILTRQ